MPRNDPVELVLAFVHATDEAVLVSGDGDREAWLPRSQINTDFDIEHLQKGEFFSVNVPEWLAYGKGLI